MPDDDTFYGNPGADSVTDFDYTTGGKVADHWFGPQNPAPAEAEPAEPADDGWDAPDEYDDPDPYANVDEYGNVDPYGVGGVQGALSGPEADAYWQAYEARNAYEQHVAYQQALGRAEEEADALVDAAARHNDVEASGRDGTIYEIANSLLHDAQLSTYNAGNEAALEQLRTPATARNAIQAAAEIASIEARSWWAWGGNRNHDPNDPDRAQRIRENAIDEWLSTRGG